MGNINVKIVVNIKNIVEMRTNRENREKIEKCGGPIGARHTDPFSPSPSPTDLKKSPARKRLRIEIILP